MGLPVKGMDRFLSPDQPPQVVSEAIFDAIAHWQDEPSTYKNSVYRYYEMRDFLPIWVGPEGVTPLALSYIELISDAPEHGLLPGDYNAFELLRLIKNQPENFEDIPWRYTDYITQIEAAFTYSFFTFANHLVGGKTPPKDAYLNWQAEREKLDLGLVLTAGITKGHLIKSIQALSPQHQHYLYLQTALVRYLDIQEQGLWETLNPGPTLQLGSKGARVETLKKRLLLTNDLSLDDRGDLRKFDTPTQAALKRFQARHLLTETGKLDTKTLATFNHPLQPKIDQLRVNLERLRWLPFTLGESYILVNIAGYRLQYFDYGQSKLEMDVIVGRPYRETPLFSAPLSAVVVNPEWRIPPSIAKDSFSTLLEYSDEQLVPLGFSRDTLSNGQTLLVQEPGPKNALGKYKFVFQNPYRVYLHDTPKKHLFKQADKRASSGCIRLENPAELAEWLIPDHHQSLLTERQPTSNWSKTVFGIKSPTQVHLIYWTAWVNGDNGVVFGKDPYSRDLPLHNRLYPL